LDKDWGFPDFYTIKSSWVDDLVVKILIYYIIFEGAKPHLVSDAHAEHTRKELMRMLTAQHAYQLLTRMLSMRTSSLRVCSA
jgi:hypothetical protein